MIDEMIAGAPRQERHLDDTASRTGMPSPRAPVVVEGSENCRIWSGNPALSATGPAQTLVALFQGGALTGTHLQSEVFMPGISVEINGTRVASIDLDGMDVVNVYVHGALDSTQKARLEAFGGNYGVGGCGHLIWIAARTLMPGDVLTVTLNHRSDSADRGKTIAELYPDDEPCAITDFSIDEQMATEIRARPRLHDDFTVQAETSSGAQASAESDELNTDFTFSFVWHKVWPTQARVRLATYCLADVLARTGGSKHLQTVLGLEDSASFILLR